MIHHLELPFPIIARHPGRPMVGVVRLVVLIVVCSLPAASWGSGAGPLRWERRIGPTLAQARYHLLTSGTETLLPGASPDSHGAPAVRGTSWSPGSWEMASATVDCPSVERDPSFTVLPNTATVGDYDAFGTDQNSFGVCYSDDPIGNINHHVYYKATSDGGLTWSAPERVDTRVGGTGSGTVQVALTPSGVPVAVWNDDRNGELHVYLSVRNSGDPENPWSENVRVSLDGNPPPGEGPMWPSIAVLDENRFYVAWTDWREGVFTRIYMRRTSDRGATWGPEQRVSDVTGILPHAKLPSLFVVPNENPHSLQETLYCVSNDWRGQGSEGSYPNVYFYRSTNGGSTWSAGVRVNNVTPFFQQTLPDAIAVVPAGILVGWMNDDGNTSVRTSLSTDGGTSWLPGEVVSAVAGTNCSGWFTLRSAGGVPYATFDTTDLQFVTHSYVNRGHDGSRPLIWSCPPIPADDRAGRTTGCSIATLSATAVTTLHQQLDETGTNVLRGAGVRLATTEVAPLASIAQRTRLLVRPSPLRVGTGASVLLEQEGQARRLADGDLRWWDASGRRVGHAARQGDSHRTDQAVSLPVRPGVYFLGVAGRPDVPPARVVVLR